MWIAIAIVAALVIFAAGTFFGPRLVDKLFAPVVDAQLEREGTRIVWGESQSPKRPESTLAAGQEIHGL
jgi:hypothetical protein